MTAEKFDHLEWAIDSRTRNQLSNLRLLKLLEGHAGEWRTKRNAAVAQDLIAVAFSLWRAAFLADKTGKRSEVLSHGKVFLETVVRDNAIGFPQDKKSQEWTFNFYTRNARYALEHLYKLRPDIVPEYTSATRPPKGRWDYCQKLLDETLTSFDTLFKENAQRKQVAKDRSARRKTRKAQRRTVRKLAEADQHER
jgi:hypothetical protein